MAPGENLGISAPARNRSITKSNLCSLLILVAFCVTYVVFDSIVLTRGQSQTSHGVEVVEDIQDGDTALLTGEVTATDGVDPDALSSADAVAGTEGVELDGKFFTLNDQSVVWTKFVDNAGLNRDIISICLWTEKHVPGMKVTNRNGYHGQRNFHTSTKPRVKELSRIVERFVEHILTSFNGGDGFQVRAKIHQSWVNINRGKAKNVWHIHGTEYISVVYYAKTLPTTAILFKEARELDGGRIDANRNGQLVAFPSFMYHGVPPTNSNEARISIAFNVKVHVVSMPRPIQVKRPMAVEFSPSAESQIETVILGQSLVYYRPLHHIADSMRVLGNSILGPRCRPAANLQAFQQSLLTFPPTSGKRSPAKVGAKLRKCTSTAEDARRKFSTVLASSMRQLVANLKARLGKDDNFKRFYVSPNLLKTRKRSLNKLALTIQRIEVVEVNSGNGNGNGEDAAVYTVPLDLAVIDRSRVVDGTVYLSAIYTMDVSKGTTSRGCNFVFQERRSNFKSWKWALRKSITTFNTVLLPNLYGFGKSELPVSGGGELFMLTHPLARRSLVQQVVGRNTSCKWLLLDLKVNY